MKKENNFGFSDYKIAMLTETFLVHEPDEQIVQNYKSYYSKAQRTMGRLSGGLAIMVTLLVPNTRIMFEDEHVLGLRSAETIYIVPYFCTFVFALTKLNTPSENLEEPGYKSPGAATR